MMSGYFKSYATLRIAIQYIERNQNGDKTSFKRTPYIGAPSFVDIINCTYDASDRSSKSYKRYAKYMKKRLIECMFGDRALPISILNAAFHKVTRPISYNEGDLVWERDFEIACSLWKKHFNDEAKRHHDSKEVSMELNLERKDRDYLYGRLLALADYFERGVLLKQQVDRPTNAVKLMSNFIAKPYSTWGALWKQLIPYLKTMNGAEWFQSGIDDVMDQLAKWKGDDEKLNAIYRYVSEHSISKDAIQYGIQLTGKDEKIGVCFEVEIPGKACRPVADDPEIRNRWIEFQQREHAWAGTDIFGRDFYSQASNYPKNIVSTAGNAKLISANDNTNFTYRGRFGNRDEALRIDSETSQKIHSTLRWLVNNHATITDTQAIIIWAVKKPEENVVNPELNFAETLSHMLLNSESEQHDVVQDALIATDMNYAKRFRALLRGYGSPDFLQKHANKMAIVILDAATSGRLSVTFYRELRENEYLSVLMMGPSLCLNALIPT